MVLHCARSPSSCSPEHLLSLPPTPQMDDAGRYQCLAENEMGAVEKVVTLVLQSESRPPPPPPLGPSRGGQCRVGAWRMSPAI